MENSLPALPSIPAKRYFTIGEVGDLCGVKPHVLRYWEQEFTQLRPMKRSGNRRYYQRHEVLMIRRIRDLLYDQGFTISGARNQLQEMGHALRDTKRSGDTDISAASRFPDPEYEAELSGSNDVNIANLATSTEISINSANGKQDKPEAHLPTYKWHAVRQELTAIRDLLSPAN